MQHHGVGTRLLDWTDNFAVALYFALNGKSKPRFSPTIWMLNPYKLNDALHETNDLFAPEYLGYYQEDEDDEDESEGLYSDYLNNEYDLWWKDPIAIYPIRRVERLTVQGGYFTIQGRDIRPLDVIVSEKQKIWAKIVIPEKAVENARMFLDLVGVNEFTLFPDLDGLARYLNKKYF